MKLKAQLFALLCLAVIACGGALVIASLREMSRLTSETASVPPRALIQKNTRATSTDEALNEAVRMRSYTEIRIPVMGKSPGILSYAHGTAQADGRFFVGMANRDGNTFPTNQLVAFMDPARLSDYKVISLPEKGDIEAMTYDAVNDKIYFTLSQPGAMNIMRLDPRTFAISSLVSTTTIDIGEKPAIATDGEYVYGITFTEPSSLFKVRISDSVLSTGARGHIPWGHSAAVGRFGSTTELYFADSTYDQFEKVSGEDFTVLGKIRIPPCAVTNDMPFMPAAPDYGYVFLGCEKSPYGYRIRTDDLSVRRFDLPGSSFGIFIFNGDLYNAAQDGHIDMFPKGDIHEMARYDTGTDMQINELFYASSTQSLYFTAWWGVKGLYEITPAGSTASVPTSTPEHS